jgi:hypothetical protein
VVNKLILIVNCSRSTKGPGPSAMYYGRPLIDSREYGYAPRIGLSLVSHETLLAIKAPLIKDIVNYLGKTIIELRN